MRIAHVCCLLVCLVHAAHAALSDEHYPIARLETSWATPAAADAWKAIPAIGITKCVYNPQKTHQQFEGSFQIAWQDQGIVLRVATKDTEAMQPTRSNPDSVANPFNYDSLEFWLNSAQFAVYELDGVATVSGFPAEAWAKEEGKKILAEISASVVCDGDTRIYQVFVPWKAFMDDQDCVTIPENFTFQVAVGMNDKDADGHAQFYSPTSYSFGSMERFASCKLSRAGAGAPAAWEASVGCQPVCTVGYDIDGFICLKLQCDEKFSIDPKDLKLELSMYAVDEPTKRTKITLDTVSRGSNRLPVATMQAFEKRICELSGYLTARGLRIPLILQERLIPMQAGICANTMQEPPPADFKAFWERLAKDALAVPLKPEISEYARNPNGSIVYKVILNGADGIPSVGFLTVPKDTSKKYPCMISGNGYGGSYGPSDDTGRGLMTFNHNARGQGYSQELHDFKTYLIPMNAPDKETYYYRQTYMDFLRVIEFVAIYPTVDANHLGVVGGSQGGALAIVGAAMDKRIKFMSVVDPGFCGWETSARMYDGGHYGSFLQLTKKEGGPSAKEVMEFLKYYDMAYLCSWITCPSLFVNDFLSYPEGKAAAYNNIPAKDKRTFLYPDGTHCYVDKQYTDCYEEWLKKYILTP